MYLTKLSQRHGSDQVFYKTSNLLLLERKIVIRFFVLFHIFRKNSCWIASHCLAFSVKSSVSDQDLVGSVYYWLSWIRILILLSDPDPAT